MIRTLEERSWSRASYADCLPTSSQQPESGKLNLRTCSSPEAEFLHRHQAVLPHHHGRTRSSRWRELCAEATSSSQAAIEVRHPCVTCLLSVINTRSFIKDNQGVRSHQQSLLRVAATTSRPPAAIDRNSHHAGITIAPSPRSWQ